MLNYESQVSRQIFDEVTLTASMAGNRKAFSTEGFSKLAVDMTYAMGAAETGNTMELQLEASSDNTNWYSLVIDDTSTVSVITDRLWQMSEGSRNILVDIAYKYVRASIKETGVASNFGTASVTITLSGL